MAYPRRRNPYTSSELAAVARQLGLMDLAGLLEATMPEFRPLQEQLVAEINAAIEPAPRRGLSDREGWLALAKAAATLPGYPEAVRHALATAFTAEANRSAA